jgi:ABC-type branched-subunit amino acid transport system ATPase component
MPAALRVHALWKSYTAGVRGCSARVLVLRGLSLTVECGERVLVVGGRGSGKTTLLHCLAGLRRPDAGVIERGAARIVLLDDGEWQGLAPAPNALSGAVLLFARVAPPTGAPTADRVLLLRDGRLAELRTHVRRRVAEKPHAEDATLR